MEHKLRSVRKPVEHEGYGLNWGFSAPEVKAAFDTRGLDFGGYDVDEEGRHGLRPDQLIPVLWKAVQQLLERVERLEADRRPTSG